jgi:adenosylcobinamide amidohydrolase
MRPSLRHLEDGYPALVWSLPPRSRCIATTVLGGGIGARAWIANVTVALDYDRPDPAVHAAELGVSLGCPGAGDGDGCCFLTGVDVRRYVEAEDAGVEAFATVGLRTVTWAADEDGAHQTLWRPGTINCAVFVPAAFSDAALVNLVATVAEAKAQALFEAKILGTGTASDAVVICVESGGGGASAPEAYGGPRSTWGARVARAVRRAVATGIRRDERIA